MALANYVLCIPAEVAQIARLGASRIVSCPGNDFSTSADTDTQSTNPPMDTDPEAADESEDGVGGQTDPEDAADAAPLELGSHNGGGLGTGL